ncbi:endonuclease domain-containing protein [Parvularcula flava]|uniref:Endonuclease domain-containing protein n=1 Tax=Aquisalinus luteolus TaxID=1566827 RepID=A0A8J3A290_9PROT|nr:DUF559 domain-containing protein [Aquisalinus luteolus]NHK28156.1 endonuclease domain-containing protein [Aquisalinus luteolus]GGH97634.1 hypothetical protein GCM10011355_19330 [Aquisalinus luteolus]
MRKVNPRAKELRQQMPEAERLLWTHIRRRQLDGHKFRRQHAIGPYIVDFICLDRKLVIELDGGQHGEADARAYDARRTEFLEQEGFDVIRFWNIDVFETLDGVLERIAEALRVPPHGD